METVERYLHRKDEELKLLNGFLADPVKLRQPRSVDEVIEQKFHLAAALKAEHHLHDWALTETAWTQSGRPKSGPFEFTYDYQRADLEVRGPSFYTVEKLANATTIYTASGMAAISTLLMALRPTFSEADIITLPNAYGETTELIQGHAKHLKRVENGRAIRRYPRQSRITTADPVVRFLDLEQDIRSPAQVRAPAHRSHCLRYHMFFRWVGPHMSGIELGA